jgi:hypothetical protein
MMEDGDEEDTTPRTKFGGKKQPAKMDFTRQFKCREKLTAGRNLASAGTDTSRRSKQPAREHVRSRKFWRCFPKHNAGRAKYSGF